MWGPLISAGANLIGGFFNREAQADANAQRMQLANAQMAEQRHYATHGIRMRVKDAEKAGIHPLFALGASTSSYTPQTVGVEAETGLGNAMSSMGQDISRAFHATRTAPERATAFDDAVKAFQLKNMELDTEIKKATLASAVQRLKQNENPPIPVSGPFEVPEAKKSEEQQPLMWMGHRVRTPRDTSPAKAVEDNLGDDIFSPGFIWNFPAVIRENVRGMSFLDILRAIDRKTRIW